MTTTTAPTRSREQRMAALRQANEVRCYRAELKRGIAVGRSARSVRQIVADHNDLEDTWKVQDLLRAVPRLGEAKVSRILVQTRISPTKTIGGLSNRQRRDLLAALAGTGA